jgi:O-antigen ligase
LVAVFFPPVVARLFSFSLGESLSERASLAQSALSMIFSRPFFGVGPNNFISSLPFFSKNSFVLQPVHNVYLLVGAELGIPGIILFCGFLWSIIKRFYLLWRKSLVVERNRLLPLGLALFAILFLGFFDHYFLTLQQGQLLFALVIGLISHEIHPPHGTIEK